MGSFQRLWEIINYKLMCYEEVNKDVVDFHRSVLVSLYDFAINITNQTQGVLGKMFSRECLGFVFSELFLSRICIDDYQKNP